MGGRNQVNKPHKMRFASKASRQIHRASKTDRSSWIGKPAKHNLIKGARVARLQHNKMVREKKRALLLKEKRDSSGPSSSPRIIVLCALSSTANPTALANDLLKQMAGEEADATSATIASPVYRCRTTVLVAPYGDLLACMEMGKVADLIAFVVSGNSFHDGGDLIDLFGTQALSVFRAVGLPSTAVMIRDLPVDIRKKHEVKKNCVSSLSSELPEDCRFYTADTKDELHKFMWLFKEQHISVPHWRNQRPYVMSQEIGFEPNVNIPGTCTLLLSGYVRAHGLSVCQLVHVSGAGDFQLSRIDVLKDPVPLNERKDNNSMDSDDLNNTQVMRTLLPDPLKQEPLHYENTPDPLVGEQTLLTEADMAEAEAENKERKLRKKTLPPGTSKYQAAWILDDSEYEDSENEEESDGMILDEQYGMSLHDIYEEPDTDEESLGNFDEQTEVDTEMSDNEHLTREQIEAEIKKLKEASAVDEEFPDEVDTPLDFPAKKRFARYRGLKSFRTSSWDPKESLPPEYARIFAFHAFKRTQKHVLSKVKEIDQGGLDECVQVGTYVRLYIKNVSIDVASKLCSSSGHPFIVACGLLQHECKMSVLHFSVKKHDSFQAPIKSKDTFIFNVGFRQFIARPIFSSDNINSTKHKMEKFLHPGRFSVASVYAPICFPPLPVVMLKMGHSETTSIVAAMGSLKSVDPDRIILKRIILTGYPQRVAKLKATVRFMFHHPDDVRWFKPIEVWSKCGRRGRIKEPVGTHGAMKCVFNGVVPQHDTVCMNLYKRSFPKWPEQRFPLRDA